MPQSLCPSPRLSFYLLKEQASIEHRDYPPDGESCLPRIAFDRWDLVVADDLFVSLEREWLKLNVPFSHRLLVRPDSHYAPLHFGERGVRAVTRLHFKVPAVS